MQNLIKKINSKRKSLILIVDDVPKNLQVLASFLQVENYSLALATNGREAIRLAYSLKPDLILLDIMMPDIDGYEVCEKIKSDPVVDFIPIIFLSAKTETEDIVKGFELGAVDYVKKPINKFELLARVKTHLSLSNALTDLQLAKNELEKNLLEKDRFFSILAHDLKNPIYAQLSLASILTQNFNTFTEEEVKTNIMYIKNSAESLSKLLEDLLTWARAQMGKIDYEPDIYDFNIVVSETIKLVALSFSNKEIELINEFDKGLEVVMDVQMILTVLRNIISNAIKFTPRGGKIYLGYKIDSGNLRVYVRDTGVGISPSNLLKLFKIDTQVKTTGTEAEIGTGLGLLLCKEFVEMNGGHLYAESEINNGSTFSFTLKLAKKV